MWSKKFFFSFSKAFDLQKIWPLKEFEVTKNVRIEVEAKAASKKTFVAFETKMHFFSKQQTSLCQNYCIETELLKTG